MVIPYDPCGRVVELGHYSYKQWVRPFRDRPDVLARIVWYPVPATNPTLGIPCSIISRTWDEERWLYRPLGEDAESERVWARNTPKPLASGRRYCGTKDDFLLGAVYPFAPQPPRRPDGLPSCCGSAFGAEWGGMATAFVRPGLTLHPRYGGMGSGRPHYLTHPVTGSRLPGPSCAAATSTPLGQLNSNLIDRFFPDQWFRIAVTSGSTYHVSTVFVPGVATLQAWYGTSCASLTAVGWAHQSDDCRDWVAPITGNLYLQFTGVPSAPALYGVTVDTGACP